MNLTDLAKNFSSADEARDFLEKSRWPDGVVCPHCGLVGESFRLEAKKHSDSPVRKGVWKCSGCRKQFTVTVGTIFEDSHIPLHKWLMAIHLLCSSKKGMSSHQLHRMLGVTYKSAWFMTHRIRYAMTQEPFRKMGGIVEIDETYVGGKIRTGTQRARNTDRPAGTSNKAAVVSVLQRDGMVHSRHVERVTAENLKPVISEMVAEEARVMTDSSTVLGGVLMGRQHDQVNHTAKEYARYEQGTLISTNRVEGFFGTLKRGINGVYHHVGKQHLHRYLSEFDFRYNTRQMKDGERTAQVLDRVTGKRLMLKQTKVN